MAKEFLKI